MVEHPLPEHITVTPEPTDEELVAIIAAFDLFWPEETQSSAAPPSTAWRFSGRWWLGGEGQRNPARRW